MIKGRKKNPPKQQILLNLHADGLGYDWNGLAWGATLWCLQGPSQAQLSHNLKGGEKKLCPFCVQTFAGPGISAGSQQKTYLIHAVKDLEPDACLGHSVLTQQDFSLMLSFQDKCQQVMNFAFFHSYSFRAWLSISAEFINGKCQAFWRVVFFFFTPIVLVSESKGKKNNSLFPFLYFYKTLHWSNRAVLLGAQTILCSREDSNLFVWHPLGLAHWAVLAHLRNVCDTAIAHLAGLNCTK